MTKRFFTSTAVAHNNKMLNMFASGNKKGNRKKKALMKSNYAEHEQHWTEIVSKSWCSSMLQETIPCLDRYKRGFKHTYNADSVNITEVSACISVMYGTLLKLYPRGSKVPIFSARVNIVCRIQELLGQSLEKQMEFIKSYSSLLKLCLMEYCYNVLLDFFPVEYSFIALHPCMVMYHETAKWVTPTTTPDSTFAIVRSMHWHTPIRRVMFDTFRRDVISTGLETWAVIDAKAASSIERCMRMCKFKMNRNTPISTVLNIRTCNFRDPLWDMRYAHGDISVLSRIYANVDKKQILFANMIQSNIMTFALPQSICERQSDSLKRIFGACEFSMNAARYLPICSTCVVNGKVSTYPFIICVCYAFIIWHNCFLHRASGPRWGCVDWQGILYVTNAILRAF